MRKLFTLFILLITSFISIQSFAQDAASTGMMESNGKIYVVIAVVVTIVTGLFLYLVNLERKIKKLEKNQ
jgi:hypothetical protein